MSLDDLTYISNVDRSNMLKLVLEFPQQILGGVEIASKLEIPSSYADVSKILATGMGGSGIPGDYLKASLKHAINVPFAVNKDYTLPRFVDAETLVLAISYSGTTEETIAAFHAARKVGAKIIGITSGATLGDLCKKYAVPCVLVPAGRQSRASFGYLFSSALVLLQRLGFIPDMRTHIEEAVDVLKRMTTELRPEIPTSKNIAKSVAVKLVGKMPFIYGVRDYNVVALRWRQQFNENSKIVASNEAFPELDHNEIVAFDSSDESYKMYEMILLRQEGEDPRIARRIELSKSIFRSQKVSFTELWSRGSGVLAKLLSLTYIGDLVSVYLAVARGTDPTPVETIKRIREVMSED